MSDEYEFTAAMLQQELPAQDFRTFTLGDSSVATRCLEHAQIWVRGKVLSAGRPYDPAADDVVRECVLKRAVYELFCFVGNEGRAKLKLRDLEDLMEAYFGPLGGKSSDGDASGGPAAGGIVRPQVPRYGR